MLDIQEPYTIFSFDGRQGEFETEDEDDSRFSNLMNDLAMNQDNNQVVSVCEALLIHHFKPQMNKYLKENFPNFKSK